MTDTKQEKIARLLSAYPNVQNSSYGIIEVWKEAVFEPEVKGLYAFVNTGDRNYPVHFGENATIESEKGINICLLDIFGRRTGEIDLEKVVSINIVDKLTYKMMKRKEEGKDFALLAEIERELRGLKKMKKEALATSK